MNLDVSLEDEPETSQNSEASLTSHQSSDSVTGLVDLVKLDPGSSCLFVGIYGYKRVGKQSWKLDWLVVLGFDATLTAKVISWQSVTHMFPGFLIPALTQLFFQKPPTTFLTCFYRGGRRKYAGKKVSVL